MASTIPGDEMSFRIFIISPGSEDLKKTTLLRIPRSQSTAFCFGRLSAFRSSIGAAGCVLKNTFPWPTAKAERRTSTFWIHLDILAHRVFGCLCGPRCAAGHRATISPLPWMGDWRWNQGIGARPVGTKLRCVPEVAFFSIDNGAGLWSTQATWRHGFDCHRPESSLVPPVDLPIVPD